MKKKKSMVFILAAVLIILAALVLFSLYGGKNEPEALPTEANPASNSASEPEGVTSVGIGDTNTDIKINQERYRFDDYVTQYEQENDIKLAKADDSMKYEFFDDIYAQGYTRASAIEDTESVSEENRELLESYINYLDSLHETCNFDHAVNEFIETNPDIDLESDPTPLYLYILDEGIDPDYLLSTMCDSRYATGFIRWYTGNDLYNPNVSTPVITDPEDVHFEIATEEEMAEQQRQVEELRRQREAEAAEAEANATNNNGRGNNF